MHAVRMQQSSSDPQESQGQFALPQTVAPSAAICGLPEQSASVSQSKWCSGQHPPPLQPRCTGALKQQSSTPGQGQLLLPHIVAPSSRIEANPLQSLSLSQSKLL